MVQKPLEGIVLPPDSKLESAAAPPATPGQRPSGRRMVLALVVAAVSDFFSFWLEMLPPVQWAIDLATAVLLFLILGRRWALLPGLIAEAIPGLAVFPWWLLVVVSIILYDEVKGRRK